MRGCIKLVDSFVVLVIFHQNSVHVTFRIAAVVVSSDFIRQLLCARIVEVSNGVIAPLLSVFYHRKNWPFVLKEVKPIFSPVGITQSPHVVVQAVLNVPHQQLKAMARRRLTKPAVLELLYWVEGFRRWGQDHRQHQSQTKQGFVVCHLWKKISQCENRNLKTTLKQHFLTTYLLVGTRFPIVSKRACNRN